MRCRTLRRQAGQAVGSSIAEGERTELLYLLAAYHRLLRLPAAVDLDPEAVARALPRLVDLLETLARAAAEPEPLVRAVGAIRTALP